MPANADKLSEEVEIFRIIKHFQPHKSNILLQNPLVQLTIHMINQIALVLRHRLIKRRQAIFLMDLLVEEQIRVGAVFADVADFLALGGLTEALSFEHVEIEGSDGGVVEF